jgi:AraC-like DNA-binding protein
VDVVRSVSRRRMGPWMQGPRGAVHSDTVELCVVEAGQVHYDNDGRRGTLSAGQIGVIPAGLVHGCWTEAEPAEEMVVHLDARAVAARLGTPAPGSRALEPAEAPHLRVLARAAAGRGSAAEADGAALALVGGFAHTTPPLGDDRLERVIDAVRADLRRRWTVGALASVAAMSPAHFSRAFHAALGAPPARWVQDQRLERARWLIRDTDQPLSEIAHQVGLSSSSRLTEGFRARYGVNPSAWRAGEPR